MLVRESEEHARALGAEVLAVVEGYGASSGRFHLSAPDGEGGRDPLHAGGVERVGLELPTINLDRVSEGCEFDHVLGKARSARVDRILSNSFGFGGTNGSLILARARWSPFQVLA